MKATVSWVGIGPQGARTSERRSAILLDAFGIQEDRHYGPNRTADTREAKDGIATKGEVLATNPRQITILSEEDVAVIADNLGIVELLPEDVGANIILATLPEFTKNAPGGTRIVFPASGDVLWVTGPNERCPWPGRAVEDRLGIEGIARAFKRESNWLGGVTAMVYRIQQGRIAPGDTAELILPRA